MMAVHSEIPEGWRQLARLFDLSNQKALVTGGAVGLGRACATALAMAGVDVAIVGRTEKAVEATCKALRQFGVEAFFVKCDVSDADQVEAMTDEVVRKFGHIDIAINNAGGSPDRPALELHRDEWTRTLDVNLSGVFWCAQAEARRMARRDPAGGKIINIASMYATVAGGNCAYNASKAGVVHLTRSLAAEWSAYNINVNCISPGWTLTPGNPLSDDLRRRMREITPLGSLMRYRDMYGAVIYLASAASDFVTGQELTIDGGHTITPWLDPIRRATAVRYSQADEESGLNVDLAALSSTEAGRG